MENTQWANLPQTQAFLQSLRKARDSARAQLEIACRETQDPKVKGAFETWQAADRNVLAIEKFAHVQEPNGNASRNE